MVAFCAGQQLTRKLLSPFCLFCLSYLAHCHPLVWNPHGGRIPHTVFLFPTSQATQLVHCKEGGFPAAELLNCGVERLKPLIPLLEVASSQSATSHAGCDAELVLELLSPRDVHVQLAQLNCVAQP